MLNAGLGLLLLFLVSALPANAAESPEVHTVAGSGEEVATRNETDALHANVGQPYGVVIGPDAALYVCEISNHLVRRVNLSSGEISVVAGTGKKGYTGDGGPARDAQLNEPYEVRFDKSGNMYFVEMQNAVVRRVDQQTGIITTIAGTGQHGFSGDDGPATAAKLNKPHSIALDDQDNLFICDIGNHRVRRVALKTGMISTFAGNGKQQPTPDGAAVEGTPLNGPRALDFDGKHSLILALREGNAIYRIDLQSQTLHHLAGTGKKGFTGDGADARSATLSGPKGVAIDPQGDIYFADTESHTIRVIRSKSGILETVVGDGKLGNGPDGGPLKCRLARPHGICTDREGNVFVGDSENHRVRMLNILSPAKVGQ